jgi:signal peptidase I
MRPANPKRSLRLGLTLLLVIVGVEFVRYNLGTFSIVEGSSMYPTFRPNDIVQARAPLAESRRGDVVIMVDGQGEQVIKRVIGLPGETVTIYRGFVYINRQRLQEPYLPKFTYTFKSSVEDECGVVWYLADNQYFVLGDNRLHSCDSRQYGPVERSQITRVVNTPANEVRPGFCELRLTESGKVVPAKYSHQVRGRNRELNTRYRLLGKS